MIAAFEADHHHQELKQERKENKLLSWVNIREEEQKDE